MKTLDKCPHCHAKLEIEGSGMFSCYLCGKTFEVAEPAPIAPPIAPAQQRVIGKRLLRSRGAGWWTILKVIGWIIIVPCLLAFVGVIAQLFIRDPSQKAGGVGVEGLMIVLVLIPISIGSLLLTIGKKHGQETVCSVCGENVGNHARLCKTCNATLSD